MLLHMQKHILTKVTLTIIALVPTMIINEIIGMNAIITA
jgi:hypothetical protein